MKSILHCACLWVLACVAFPALAWSPGPYSLHRMAVFSDGCLVGKVTGLRVVGRQGKFEISEARIQVKRWVFGGHKGKLARVLYHSKTDDFLDVATRFQQGERVLLFVRRRLHVVGHRAPKFRRIPRGLKPPLYVLQFAKARNVGYKLKIVGRRLKGFMDKSDPRRLSKALAIVRRHRPGPAVRGLRALLWTHTRQITSRYGLFLQLTLRNMRPRKLGIMGYREPDQVWLDIYRPGSAGLKLFKRIEIYRDLRKAKRAAAAPSHRRTLLSGAGLKISFSRTLKQLKLPKGRYLLRARYKGRSYRRIKKKVWTGRVFSNNLEIWVK